MSNGQDGGILVWLKSLGGKSVHVMNADDAEKVAELDAKAENEDEAQARRDREAARHEGGEVEEAEKRLALIEEMKATIESIKTERDGYAAKAQELEAQLEEMRLSIEGGEADDIVEERADEMAAEREEGADVMNAAGVMNKSQALNSFKKNKLRGKGLKVFVMNSIREKKGRPAITQEQEENAVAVNAMWDVVKESVGHRHVVGAIPMNTNVQAFNSREDRKWSHLEKLGYKKEGAK